MAEDLNLKTVDTVDLRPFKKLVMTIGELPSSFVESMTYYECLAWLVNYIETTVIPAVNNNAEAVEELQGLFTELKTFVDDYFDNLDVQEEINKKLDAFATDGTLYRLINEQYFSEINNRLIAQSQSIGTLENEQLQNVKKDEANSVSMNMLSQEVRDALTGGSTAVVGIDSIGTENIKNGAVTILKLETNLQNNFDMKMTKVNLGTGQPGFYYVTGNTEGGNLNYTLPSSNNVNYCYTVPLTKGKTYRYTGFNYSATRGLVVGTAVGSPALLLSPSNGALDLDTYTGIQSDIYGSDIVFTVTEDNLIAYITTFTDSAFTQGNKPSLLKDYASLYEINDITPYDRTITRDVWNNVTPLYTYANSYIQQVVNVGETNVRNPYRLQTINNANYSVSIYKIFKNHKYKVTGRQQYANAGFMLLDNYCKITYVSLVNTINTATDYEYEFTATNDGIAVTQNTSTANKSYFFEASESSLTNSRLSSKTIAYNGDSITESRLNTSVTTYNGGAYPKIIADLTNSTYANFAVSGGTLAEIDTSVHIVVDDIVNMNGNYDAIIFSGGINDYWKNVPLGTYTEGDYTSEVDKTTICGALESIFRQAINKWCGKPIMFVITHKIGGTAFTNNTAGYSFNDVHDRIVGICHKYSIPYYDAYQDSGLNSYLDIMNTTFMTAGASGRPDHTHPNESAYKKYYVPQIISMIEDNLEY